MEVSPMGLDSERGAGAKPKRQARLWDSGNGWVLTITTWPPRSAAVDTHYHLSALASDWGRAFRLVKVTDDGTRPVYAVNLSADGPTCDCKGHERWGHCKHVESLLALQAKGKLDALPAPKPTPKPVPKPKPPARPAAVLDDL
jgi:hypothetical protein